MNTPISWLKAYVPDLDVPVEDFVDAITLSGSHVESYEKKDKNLDKIVVGKILEIKPHPDATKLVICQVDVGAEAPIQIVTGASNMKEGDLVPTVLDGGRVAGGHDGGPLPENGIKIKKGKLRGVESFGMMCSIEELGSSRDLYPEAPEEGLYVFPVDADVKPGDDAALAVKSGDDEADDAGFQDSAADPKKPETVKNGDRSDKADKTDEADKADEADGADELTKTRGLIVSKVIEKTGSKPDEEDDRIVLKELERNYERGDFPEMDIDFESLSEINPDVVAWVYVGATKIDYPVVQTEDNEFYLHQTFEGKKNSSGCIFMDWEVNKDLSSPNTFIYGHNMKNGSMFGSLKQFIWNEKTYDKDPYIFVYIPGYIYRYKIFSCKQVASESEIYSVIHKNTPGLEAYAKTFLIPGSVINEPTDIRDNGHVLALSTCVNDYAYRMIVCGVREEEGQQNAQQDVQQNSPAVVVDERI